MKDQLLDLDHDDLTFDERGHRSGGDHWIAGIGLPARRALDRRPEVVLLGVARGLDEPEVRVRG